MCGSVPKAIVGTGVFLMLFCSLGLFAIGIYTALGSTLRVKDNYLLILIFVCASLLFISSILGLITVFGQNQAIAILYALTLVGIMGLEVYLAVVFLGGTRKDFSPKQIWNDLPVDVQHALEKDLGCCGFDSLPVGTNCTSQTPCKSRFEEALYTDRYIIGYSMVGVAAIQLINIIFVGFLAGRYSQRRLEKSRNKTLLEEARETRRL